MLTVKEVKVLQLILVPIGGLCEIVLPVVLLYAQQLR